MKKVGTHLPLAVGVTGGIGSGKTEVCNIFASLGAKYISSDLLARKLLDTDPIVRKRVNSILGADLYTPDGTMNRKELAKRVFSDDTLLKKLNEIVHPRVVEELRRMIIDERKKRSAPMIVVEAALIYEARIEAMFDYIIVVTAEDADRTKRVVRRDGSTDAEILQRMKAQMPQDAAVKRADVVIQNAGDLHSLRTKSEFIFTLLSGMQPPDSDDAG